MGTRYRCVTTPPGQAVELASTGGTAPTGGTYTLSFGAIGTTACDSRTMTNPALVTGIINTLLGAGSVNCLPDNPAGAVPPYVIQFIANGFQNNPPTVLVNDNGLTGGGVYEIDQVSRYSISWDNTTSAPTSGFFTLTATTATATATTTGLPFNVNNVAIRQALTALTNIGANNCITDIVPLAGFNALPQTTVFVTFCGTLANTSVNLTLNGQTALHPILYGINNKTSDVFVMRFKQSAKTVLDPTSPESVLLFGGDGDELLSGFAVLQKDNPLPTDPITFAFGGILTDFTPEISTTPLTTQVGYVSKYTYSNSSGAFTKDPKVTQLVTGGSFIDLNGLDMDKVGNVYVGGTCHFQGNVDTSLPNPPFVTTPGVFAEGRLLRNDDFFVRRYNPDGTLGYSALIGGNDNDECGGLDFDLDGTTVNAGSCIAVDANQDLYITGVSGSFNFPRTRGVFGETFTAAANVTVTKLNSDCSQILYSTNLQTNGLVLPAGIAVDTRGDAFITGNIHPDWMDFPDTFTENPMNAGTPNEPNSQPLGTIQTTPDGLVLANPQVTGGGEIATREGFLNEIDPTASTLIYGTYLGGPMDDVVYGPYVDSFGDVWVFGWTDSYRQYVLQTPSPPPVIITTTASLPAAMISANAFKATGDAFGYTNLSGILYGALSQTYPNYTPWSWNPTTTAPGFAEATISGTYRRDGWVDKLRVGLPSVQSVTLTPTTIPGGLGATSIGNVTLSAAAPSGGADIVLTLDSTVAASFSSSSPQSSTVVTIPAGATTLPPGSTFTIYSSAVSQLTGVHVKATYQGSFIIVQLNVTPWLQQLSLTPTSVVGGTGLNGRLTLAALPPTGSGGVVVTVLSDSPTLVVFPQPSGPPTPTTQVTVPEGQTSVLFAIDTNGVAVTSFPQITASLLGVGITQVLTLTPGSLSTLTFSPATVAGGTSSLATLSLNGNAAQAFPVALSASNPAFTFADANTGVPITSVTVQPQASFATFTVLTPYESASTQVVVTATAPTQGSVSGTLFVKQADLTVFQITNPAPVPPATYSEVPGGTSATGTISIGAAAPAGGVMVNLKSNNVSAQVPATVTVPSGATTATFTITTSVIAATTTATITASRGAVSISQQLQIDGVTFSLSLSPTTVVGGPSGVVTGTLTLASPAPSSGLQIDLLSSDAKAAYFTTSGVATGSATVPGGSLTGTFTIFTGVPAGGTETVTISAKVHGSTSASQASSASLTVEVTGVASLTFSPSTVRGGQQTTFFTITLEAPAPPGGLTVVLSQSLNLLGLNSSGYHIPAGQTSLTQGVTSIRVSRSLETLVTATPSNNGDIATAVVVVTR